ncbi:MULTISPECIES: hypothetical protein [unclassified Rhizobacter]|uniref:hypothetical protein n=1 Tax=unclassified Rhizobacter TaxID=2640088 RepID=UPI0006F6EAE8|nr:MULTISPECIES: hypothetical protein [unclassified Rhizobacter]KQU73509.1 hypothetical protein ASC88_04675 [Rhizobacter sp. Root29]KQV98694.1 hypothetical protein ASC98_08505 [Rhizobacter sp. Root1238]KRB04948.1 hypothetical protein ASE08_13660 [Rhizobacter sp. Root16D2]
MKSLVAAIGAFVVGLLLTWLCLYTLSHAHLPHLGQKRSGCDVDHCGPSWVAPATLVFLLLPAVGFAFTGYVAARRGWTVRKTGGIFAILIVATTLLFTCMFML